MVFQDVDNRLFLSGFRKAGAAVDALAGELRAAVFNVYNILFGLQGAGVIFSVDVLENVVYVQGYGGFAGAVFYIFFYAVAGTVVQVEGLLADGAAIVFFVADELVGGVPIIKIIGAALGLLALAAVVPVG